MTVHFVGHSASLKTLPFIEIMIKNTIWTIPRLFHNSNLPRYQIDYDHRICYGQKHCFLEHCQTIFLYLSKIRFFHKIGNKSFFKGFSGKKSGRSLSRWSLLSVELYTLNPWGAKVKVAHKYYSVMFMNVMKTQRNMVSVYVFFVFVSQN